MQNIRSATELKEAIILLELRQAQQETELKEELSMVFESLKPINLIKSTVRDFVSSPDLKSNLVDLAIGLTTGFISKKVLVGGSHNPIRKIVGTLAEIGMAGLATKNADGIKSVGLNLIKKIFSKKNAE